MAAPVSSAELLSAINGVLSLPIASHVGTTPSYDLYEAYLYTLAITAAESMGMTVSFVDSSGAPATSLVLRRSPSTIWSGVESFTHGVLSVDGVVRLEAHLGVYLRAGSGVSHEGDVVVLDATEAARARALRIDPRANTAAVIIEAKFHGANIRLRTGREFLGLVTDLGAAAPIFVSSSPGASVHRLLSYRKRAGHFDLIPGGAQENELKGQLATRLRDYLARH